MLELYAKDKVRLLTVEEENKNAIYTAQELKRLDSKVRKFYISFVFFVIEFLIYHGLFTDSIYHINMN